MGVYVHQTLFSCAFDDAIAQWAEGNFWKKRDDINAHADSESRIWGQQSRRKKKD